MFDKSEITKRQMIYFLRNLGYRVNVNETIVFECLEDNTITPVLVTTVSFVLENNSSAGLN